MKTKPVLTYLLHLSLAAAGLCAFVFIMGALVRPRLSVAPPSYPPDQIQAARRAGRADLDCLQ